jgi:hypothetical protein
MTKEQTFRSEDMPFGIANAKSQIPKYGICNLGCEIPSASEDQLLQVCPSLSFNCGIRVDSGQTPRGVLTNDPKTERRAGARLFFQQGV